MENNIMKDSKECEDQNQIKEVHNGKRKNSLIFLGALRRMEEIIMDQYNDEDDSEDRDE